MGKLVYFYCFPELLRVIRSFKPDILHAHYASSYGLIGFLTFFKPFVVSVWGSDVYDFPKLSPFHKLLIKLCLKRADKILSTSETMARETKLYTKKAIEITPFGIDLKEFKSKPQKSVFEAGDIVVGTVKTMSEKYGIKYLVKAFAKVKDRHPELPLKLLLVGGGEQSEEIYELISKLGLKDIAVMIGAVPYNQVSNYHNMMTVSVFVSVSDSESFGVSVIEASACEKPVIVSNVGGLPEVVEDGVTGIVVPSKDIESIANTIEKLVMNNKLREKMGKAGRKRVEMLYNWYDNVEQMIGIYKSILAYSCKKDIESL